MKFFDTFVVLNPGDVLISVWPEEELSEGDRDALALLLTCLGTFGRAESWCEADLPVSATVPQPNSMPLSNAQTLTGSEPVRVLIPDAQGADLLATLMIETTTMRTQKYLDPPGSRWMTYTRRADALSFRRVAPLRRTSMQHTMTVARYALDATVLPLVRDTLPFAERVRRALIGHRMQMSHSEVLMGKTVVGTPLAEHAHAHYLATDEDGDGRLDHVTIYAPSGFNAEDVTALGQLRRIFQSGNRPEVRTVLTGLGDREQFAKVPVFDSSPTWRSVTPFALPRFASRGVGKPPRPRDLPEAQLRRELRVRHLPEPVTVKPVTGHVVPGRPVVRWLEFHTRRFNGEQGYGLAGFELEFVEAVAGPITLGFACHFGLGLFMPTA